MGNNESNASSIGSLICGIVSFFIIPRVFGLIAVILGIIGVSRDEDKKTYAIIGIVLGIASFIYSFTAQGPQLF